MLETNQEVMSDLQESHDLLLIDTQTPSGIKKSQSKANQLGSVTNPLIDKLKKSNSKEDLQSQG